MAVLLMRLAGPMQAWCAGAPSHAHDVAPVPSSKDVCRLLCDALGIPPEGEGGLQTFTGCRLGVRVDREGRVVRAPGATDREECLAHCGRDDASAGAGWVSEVPPGRWCITGADYLVGLASLDNHLLEYCHHTLEAPRGALLLGCEACVPAEPIFLPDGLREGRLETVLRQYPWRATPDCPVPGSPLRLVLETAEPPSLVSPGSHPCPPARRVQTRYILPEEAVLRSQCSAPPGRRT